MSLPIEVINAASGSVDREETRHWLTDLFAANGVEANHWYETHEIGKRSGKIKRWLD